MSKLLFDAQTKWQTTVGDLNNNTARRYFAAPHNLIMLVVHEAVVKEVEDIPYSLHGLTFNANIGWHNANAISGFTLPKNVGFRHTKITLRNVIDDQPNTLLSDVILRSPAKTGYIQPPDLVKVTGYIPPLLLAEVEKFMKKNNNNISTLIWELLQDYVEDY